MILFSDTPVHDETPDLVARQSFREALAQVVADAREPLKESGTRLDRAVKLVLAGDVHILADRKHGMVNSQSDPNTRYMVNDVCQCKDFEKAPQQLCSHRIALYLYRKALKLWQPPAPPIEPELLALPEAPASINVKVMIEGRFCQLTLRDADEKKLIARMQRVLEQYPAARKE